MALHKIKASNDQALPPGGTAGQLLTKQSSTEGDAAWISPPSSSGTIEGWISPTLNAGYYNYDAANYPSVQYQKDPFGVVHFRGLLGVPVASGVAFTLPVGYRPPAIGSFGRMHHAVATGGGYGNCTVDGTTGNVTATGNVSWVDFSHVTFDTGTVTDYLRGQTGATGATGAAGLVWRGTWNGATTYAVNDAVTYLGSSYHRLVAGTTATVPPSDATNWELIAAKGDTGTTGTAGSTVLNGTSVPGAGLGNNGDFYLNTATAVMYGPKTGGAWGSGFSLIGPQGPQGNVGPTGPTGPVSVGLALALGG